MRVQLFPDDAAYILLREIRLGDPAFTEKCRLARGQFWAVFQFDFDGDGRLIGIELQPASELLLPELLADAEKLDA